MFSFFRKNKVIIHKEVGETPLQALERFVERHPRYKGLPATYAGRLDPMASGRLLLLFGEECKKKEQYLSKDKEYDVEVLLGVGSDTGDILGKVEISETISKPDLRAITKALAQEVGTHTLPYPVYSSKTVAGKPLFTYALEGTLGTIQIPVHEETFYSIQLKKIYEISHKELQERITTLLNKVPSSDDPRKALGADFRIALVQESWKEVFYRERAYTVLALRVRCGSGAYMRTFAERIGKNLGTRALALSITRTKIG